MLATYVSVILVCAVSLLLGAAALFACGRRSWSWTAPALGLGLLFALCWATVRLPGHGIISALLGGLLALGSLALLWGRLSGVREAARQGLPLALAALIAGSLPFLVEGHFGILGTSLDPDMSQHLFTAARLADPTHVRPPLLAEGYPLGPHAVVVALRNGLGIGLVQGFGGLTLAATVLACLTALGALRGLSVPRRAAGAFLIGVPYMVASYIAQGAFKETVQALLFLAFAIELHRLSGQEPSPGLGRPLLRAVPLALLGVGSIYVYSFPGIGWLGGALVIWALAELALRARTGDAVPALRRALAPALLGLGVFLALSAPEIGRMVDFRSFETFNPAGPGLGNLFGQISPFEVLGIWPSGDFRVMPGGGEVPAIAFYAGAALGLCLLIYGLAFCVRRRETAFPAAFLAALGAFAVARIGGTPYTTAKAIAIMAPIVALLIVRAALSFEPGSLRPASLGAILRPLAAAAFVVSAGACTVLALANAPVGPTSYSPALTAIRGDLRDGSVLVQLPAEVLRHQHGVPFITWELRRDRVCVRAARPPSRAQAAHGIRYVVSEQGGAQAPPFAGLRLFRRAGPYLVWRRLSRVGRGPCPLVRVRQRGKPQAADAGSQ